jgi:hypothetical protein
MCVLLPSFGIVVICYVSPFVGFMLQGWSNKEHIKEHKAPTLGHRHVILFKGATSLDTFFWSCMCV